MKAYERRPLTNPVCLFLELCRTLVPPTPHPPLHLGLVSLLHLQVLTMSYPHVLTVGKSCTVASTRQAMEAKFNSRCLAQNAPLLEQITALRHRIAQVRWQATSPDKRVPSSKQGTHATSFW